MQLLIVIVLVRRLSLLFQAFHSPQQPQDLPLAPLEIHQDHGFLLLTYFFKSFIITDFREFIELILDIILLNFHLAKTHRSHFLILNVKIKHAQLIFFRYLVMPKPVISNTFQFLSPFFFDWQSPQLHTFLTLILKLPFPKQLSFAHQSFSIQPLFLQRQSLNLQSIQVLTIQLLVLDFQIPHLGFSILTVGIACKNRLVQALIIAIIFSSLAISIAAVESQLILFPP